MTTSEQRIEEAQCTADGLKVQDRHVCGKCQQRSLIALSLASWAMGDGSREGVLCDSCIAGMRLKKRDVPGQMLLGDVV